MTGLRTVACAMKDEAPYIVEWVAYNRIIGFDRIVIGSNDSSDGTSEILAALAMNNVVDYIENAVGPNEVPQHAFYEKLQNLELFQATEWLAVIDSDEFINIHVGSGLLGDLFAAVDGADIVQLNWAVFGNSGRRSFSQEPVVERFTKRIAEQHRINAGCKCLVRNPQRFERLRNHNPARFIGAKTYLSVFHGGEIRKLSSEADLTKSLQYTSSDGVSFDVAQINHYAIKTWPEYILRQFRGRGALSANQEGKQRHDARYFGLRAQADVEDMSILRHASSLKLEIAALVGLPGVGEAIQYALGIHCRRLEEIDASS